MSDRREFLKRAGALVAVPWSKVAFSDAGYDSAEGLPKMKWVFSEGAIHVSLDGQQILRSLGPAYQEHGAWENGTELKLLEKETPYSDQVGRGLAIKVCCKLGLVDGVLVLVEYEDGKLGCRLSVTNNGPSPHVLESYSPLRTRPGIGTIELQGHPAEWRVYVDSGGCGGRCASYGLNENEGQNTAGAVSVLWSPGGHQSLAIGQAEVERSWTTITYQYGTKGINNRVYHWAQTRKVDLLIEQDATGYQLDPGETFHLDLCMLIFHPNPFNALIALRDAMVVLNLFRSFSNNDAWVGWMTWYNQEAHLRGGFGATGNTCASEAVAVEQSHFIRDSGLRRYGLKDVVIDDGYQRNLHLGEWLETTSMFPTGMQGVAGKVRQLGMTPGVWIAPFVATEDSPVYKEHPDWFVRYAFDWYHADPPVRAFEFDPTAPGALDWLLDIYQTFKGWGYRFFKNDFSGGLISSQGKQYYNRKQTGLMRWRWTWRKIKEALGGDGVCSIQLCGANNIGGIGIVDSVPTGNDVGPCVGDKEWRTISQDAGTTGINRWWQNKHFFICDPDNLEVAEYKDYRLYQDKVDFDYKMAMTWDEARVRATLVVAVGGNIVLGDRLTLLDPGKIAIIKKTLPLYGESAIPLDMFEQTIPCLWWHHLSKPWGSWEVLSVVNFGESSLVKEIPLSRMGLRGDQILIAWEFWDEIQHLDIADGVLLAVVKPHSVKTFRITAIEKDRPALVASSFHFTMGGVEVKELISARQGVLRAHVWRPEPEEGKCSFWSAKDQKVITVPVKAGPQGTEVKVS
jgi:hypothetical protein